MIIKDIISLKYTLLMLGGLFFYEMQAQTDTIQKNIQVQFDTIKFVNGNNQPAKIIEISGKYVKYKNPRDTLGPTFLVKRKEVAGFVFRNGCLDMDPQGFLNCVKDPVFEEVKKKDFTRKIISIDVFQLSNFHFQMNADFIFKRQKNGIGLFFNSGLSDETNKETYKRIETRVFSVGYYKKAYAGIDYKFFPIAHKKFTYFLSLGLDFGTAYLKEEIIDNSYYFGTSKRTRYSDLRHFGYRVNNGVIIRVSRQFICQCIFTAGVNQYTRLYDAGKEKDVQFFPKITGNILLGYAF